ncbi:fibronectin type III domain-containing protein [Pedobacter sp. MC2016-14]|uniref:fibronectin type III domain-containing protein n=1 Tax=Pedobacter sp. MC2016-14 TaxID=2897327 RepID=UPI001E32932C|nr:fibronectin type III domain-containing protein [Pedobacter sp. MC2016-14]MCD0490331.1 fibronectin type III domain-containing protein [Pedobacter sp. MC2016-14]
MYLKIRSVFFLFIYAVLFSNIAGAQVVFEPIHATPLKWKAEGISILLKDDLNHAAFSWPLSVLQYRIDFTAASVKQNELNLTEGLTGKEVAFQLSSPVLKNGILQEATLSFMSDLPSGTNKLFRLVKTKGKKGKDMVADVAAVAVAKTTDAYLISNGKIKIEVPLQGAKIAAPVKRYGNAGKWLGHGVLPASLTLGKMTVTELSAGPVEVAYLVKYEFGNNKTYQVKISLAAGMDFAELEEEMLGFDINEGKVWNLIWDNISLDHRYASTRSNKINTKLKDTYDNFSWEPMEGLPVAADASKHPDLSYDQQNGKDGKLPFRISPYDNWMSWWRLPTAAFWSEKEHRTIGLFIKDMEKWDDGLYAIWGSKQNLNICFHWNNNILDYTFPLVNGTRSTAIAAYNHQKDVDVVNKNLNSLLYIDDLRRWYGWMPLNKVKNWVLNYDLPETGYPKYFKPENGETLTLPKLDNQLFNALKSIGTGSERVEGPNPVGSRIYYDAIIPAFDLNAAKMSSEQYRKLRAWQLFVGYLYMDETLMPMRKLLSGHPNFLGDIKGVVGLMAFLFPNHPEAAKMADHFEKVVNLNFNYHTRPDVPLWDAKGGRWTENLATYTWAALKPVLRTSYLLNHNYDGKNRYLQPGVSQYGNWLVNAATSPIASQKNRRLYPPQGAHSHAYGDGPPNALRLLGQELSYYNPILAENLLWFTSAEDSPFESNKEKDKAWTALLHGEWEKNKGTNPHLKSAKYTGYGNILRSAFGTKDEMYVNLQQIDEGPNYRWGRAAMGGNGVIYYYAQGKRYSHNGSEDVGDGPFGDVERISNFGVKKAGGYRALGPYRSVGRNDLTEPLYDFGFAQFASVKAEAAIAADYRSRSVLQSGSDYIAVYDDVASNDTEGRFSWFVGAEDDFPSIHQVLPGAIGRDADIKPSKSNYHKDPAVMPTKGRYYDGKGSFLTIVTHKPEIKVNKADFGCTVEKGDGSLDLVFRSAGTTTYQKDGLGFTGSSGIIQKDSKGNYSAALFAGSKIEVPGLKIEISGGNKAGLSLQQNAAGFKGQIQVEQAVQLVLTAVTSPSTFYLDGVAVPNMPTDNTVRINVLPGKHTWQWSSNGVIPGSSTITSTLVKNKGVLVSWAAVPGALTYNLQLSEDGGTNWATVKENITKTEESLSSLTNGTKIHLRVIANAKGGNGDPSDEYPVYVTDQAAHAPEGLLVDLTGVQNRITWGTVLGAGKYTLYRRIKSLKTKTSFTKIYEGPLTAFADQKPAANTIYEYAVTAINGNGASKFSNIIDTDPLRFNNWTPKPREGFRRDTEDHENGFMEFNPFIEDKKPVIAYPVIK